MSQGWHPAAGGDGPAATIVTGSNSSTADGSGDYDILFDLPPPGGDRFGAGETLIYNISGSAGLIANSFLFLSENFLDETHILSP